MIFQSSRGQLSLDLILSLLVFLLALSALIFLALSLQDNAIEQHEAIQKKIVANYVANQLTNAPLLLNGSDLNFFTPSIRDVNGGTGNLYCGIRTQQKSTGIVTVNVTYPGFTGSSIEVPAVIGDRYSFSTDPVLVPCGCLTISKTSDEISLTTC